MIVFWGGRNQLAEHTQSTTIRKAEVCERKWRVFNIHEDFRGTPGWNERKVGSIASHLIVLEGCEPSTRDTSDIGDRCEGVRQRERELKLNLVT